MTINIPYYGTQNTCLLHATGVGDVEKYDLKMKMITRRNKKGY